MYAYPILVHLFPGSRRGVNGAEIISVIGYRGPGILLRYNPEKYGVDRLKGILDNSGLVDKSESVLVHFPCRNPSRICSLVHSSS
jgi:hypothetical protein